MTLTGEEGGHETRSFSKTNWRNVAMNQTRTKAAAALVVGLILCVGASLAHAQRAEVIIPTSLERIPVDRFLIDGQEYVQAEFSSILTEYRGNAGAVLDETEQQWLEQLNRPHPSVATLAGMFSEAAEEFDVPVALLMAIAHVESNWTQIGPSIDFGYGIMHLVSNSYSDTLEQASALIDVDTETLKVDPRQNIRAGAALLAAYAGPGRAYFDIQDWVEPLKRFSGLIDDSTRRMQAIRYLRTLRKGALSITLWKEAIELPATDIPAIDEDLEREADKNRSPKSTDYGPAEADYTSCNYNSRNGTDINAWTNHWIGTGTFAGAISWFKNCNADVSAHFLVAHGGRIVQMVRVADRAWHAGAVGTTNNSRSIGVEHEATAANPGSWNNTAMLQASASMARYFCDRENITKTHRTGGSTASGIFGHKDMPGTNTSCPGPLPWNTWMGYLSGDNNTGRLVGVVYKDLGNDDMSVRILGASVSVSNGSSTTSNDSGGWEFQLAPGTYTVEASASGYSSKSRTCTVTAGTDTWCSIGLSQSNTRGRLIGAVYVDQGDDDMSQRLPGAQVSLSAGGSTTARADDAIWSFDLAPGTYTAEASASGYQNRSRTCTVVAGEDAWCSIGLSEAGCSPDCSGRVCGPDPVCGESCGSCGEHENCNAGGQCDCVPDCSGMQCGPDPICGQSCGTCAQNLDCADGQCECKPDCSGLECGLDPVCGTSCGSCQADQGCEGGTCVDDGCQPDCGGRTCGLDPVCGISCGACDSGWDCSDEGVCKKTVTVGCAATESGTNAIPLLGLMGLLIWGVWARSKQ